MARYSIVDEHDGYKFEWMLKLYPDSTKPGPLVGCTVCLGRGRIEFEDPDQCWRCKGSGQVVDPNWSWNPEPPKELVDAIRKVWKDYWNKQMNEKFELTSQ